MSDQLNRLRQMWEAEIPPAKEEALAYLRKAEARLEAGEYDDAASAMRAAAACADHCARIAGHRP